MKASMKKQLLALQVKLTDQLAEVQVLLQEEESYACDLEDDDKIEASEGRQELLSTLGELIEAAGDTLTDLLSE